MPSSWSFGDGSACAQCPGSGPTPLTQCTRAVPDDSHRLKKAAET